MPEARIGALIFILTEKDSFGKQKIIFVLFFLGVRGESQKVEDIYRFENWKKWLLCLEKFREEQRGRGSVQSMNWNGPIDRKKK